MKRKREEKKEEEPNTEKGSVDRFFRLCTNKDIDGAIDWWKKYGDERWNDVSKIGKRTVAHCAIRSGSLELVKMVHETAHDVFLDASEQDACTVFHEAIIHGVPLDIFRFLCDNFHWQDVAEDGDMLGRPAIVSAIQRWPKGDPRLLLLIEYYGKHVPGALTKNPVELYYQTPWECANKTLDKDSECFKRMEAILAQSPLSPVQPDLEASSSQASSSSSTQEEKSSNEETEK